MREKKKIPLKLIILSMALLLALGGTAFCIVNYNLSKNKVTEENKVTETDKNKEKEEQDEKKPEEPKVEDKGEESINNDDEKKVGNTPETNNNSSSNQNSKPNTNNTPSTNNVNSNQNNNSSNNTKNETVPKKETPVEEKPKQEPSQPVVPSCTPKKFDMSFVRADFSSFGECTSKGDKYKTAGYGYFCDAYQDDCGTTYYMLTIYESHTLLQYFFHKL